MMTQQLFFLKSFGFFKAFNTFDFLILIATVLFLIGGVFSLIYAFKLFIKRQEKANLMEEKVLPELFPKFGKVISIEAVQRKRLIKFERNGTLFEINVKPAWDVDKESSDVTENIVQFSLPDLREKFFIQHKSLFSSKTYKDCESVPIVMPNDFMFYSLNPQFLANLVAKDSIRSEIYKYQKKVSREFSVALIYGSFTVTWHRAPNDGSDEISWGLWKEESPKEEVQRLEQLCQTAIVFYDELTKK